MSQSESSEEDLCCGCNPLIPDRRRKYSVPPSAVKTSQVFSPNSRHEEAITADVIKGRSAAKLSNMLTAWLHISSS